MRLAKLLKLLLLLCAALAVVLGLWLFGDHTVDDAYISFRYAHHLTTGGGLTWNVGEAPVEGYTNFLWTLLLAGADWLGLPLVTTARCLGITCLLLVGWVVWHHVRAQTDDEPAAFVALFALLAYLPAYVHAVAGLETMLYALLLLLATTTAERQADRQAERGLWRVPLLVLLAGLTRPEGVVAAGFPLLWLLLCQPPALRRRTLRWAGLVLVLPATCRRRSAPTCRRG